MKKKEIDYHSNVGLSMYNMKRYDESIYQFKKSIKKDPKYDQLHCLLALILIKQKNYKEAADVMEGAFSVHQIDKTEFTYYTMGTLLFKQGDYSSSILHLSRSLQLYFNSNEGDYNGRRFYYISRSMIKQGIKSEDEREDKKEINKNYHC